MDLSVPASAHPAVLARIIAALANSGGGRCTIEGDPASGRDLLKIALQEIVPSPGYSATRDDPSPKDAAVSKIIPPRPAEVSVREGETGLIITVTPGHSLCTVGGVIFVYEDGAIRTLSLTEVVRRAGSGG